MTMTATKTVREVALENPNATRIFEKLGIDYCCGGQRPLNEACAAANLNIDDVLSRLEQAGADSSRDASGKNWQTEALGSLVEYIVATHHAFIKDETPRILQLAAKVVSVHGRNHPELQQVHATFDALGQELSSHLMKEEQILFPFIVGMDRASGNGSAAPASCFGTVQNPIRMMMIEHDSAGNALRELREVTSNYTVPADACISYKTLYQALQDFEKDLHQHIHLENNILFPRALTMENA